MSRHIGVTVILVALAVPQPCRAQALPLGRWTGSAGPSDRPDAHLITFDVTAVADSLHIMLHPDNNGDDYRFDAIRVRGDTLSFTLHLARPLPPGDIPGGANGVGCVLLRQRDASYAGLCTGPDGMRSDLRMIPPGSTQAADTVKDQGEETFRPEGADFVITFVIEFGRATSFMGHREDGVLKGARTQ